MNSIPHLSGPFMQQIDGREIQILNMPIEEGPPSPNEQKGSIETTDLLRDNFIEERLELSELPLTRGRVHERMLNIRTVNFLVQSVHNVPKLHH